VKGEVSPPPDTQRSLVLPSSTPLSPVARALVGFGRAPARSGPLQHGPVDAAAASRDLVAAGAALALHAAVLAFLRRLRRGEELLSGIRQIRARRRRRQWRRTPWRPTRRSTSRSSSSPLGVSGASWLCPAMGGQRRSRPGR